MELWEQLLAGAIGLLVLFIFFPGIKATMEKSKNAEEKHWGTLALLAIVLVAFIMLMISSIQ
jgi:NADH:ubiquinone oxidoreductase subunit 6 (subunit J)